MDKIKLLKLFIKAIGSPVNINGLLLYPQLNEDNIEWEIENPKDVSYSNFVVDGHIEEIFYDFMGMTGTKDNPIWGTDIYTKYCRLGNVRYFYINQELRDKINNKCNKLTSIKLEDGETLNSECYVLNWDIGYESSEMFNFYISLELTNPKIDGEDVDDDTLEAFIKEFTYEPINNTSGEQELDLVWHIITTIIDDKNMYDSTYMYSQAVIGYFDRFGNGLT
jgi:hypothetical protein